MYTLCEGSLRIETTCLSEYLKLFTARKPYEYSFNACGV